MELAYGDIVRALKAGDFETVNEATLSRLYRHYVAAKEGKGSFAILTSWRVNPNEPDTPEWHKFNEENNRKFKELQRLLRGWGYGFNKLKGYWLECTDDTYDYHDCPKDKLARTIEPALFVPDITLDHALEVMERYKQNAIIYSGPETSGQVTAFYANGKKEVLGKFNPNLVKATWERLRKLQGWSELRGRKFVFEGFFRPPESWIEAVAYGIAMNEKKGGVLE